MEKETGYLIMARKMAYCYLFLFNSLFLFWFTDYYYNLNDSKYYFYITITAITLLISGVLYALHKLQLKKDNQTTTWKQLIHLSITDKLLFLCLCSYLITTIISSYPSASCYGMIRHTGLIFALFLAGTYAIVSRLYQQQQSILLLFLGSVGVVVIIGMLQFFNIDPLGFFQEVSDYRSNFYLSTMGNINFFSSLICLSLPLTIVLYLYCENTTSKILYSISMILCFIGLMIANSDSGYFGIFTLLLIIAYFALKNIQYLKRYFIVLLYFLGTFKLMGILIYFMQDSCRELHTFSHFIAYRPITWIFLVIVGIAYLLMDVYTSPCEKYFKDIQKVGRGLLLLIVILAIGLFLYYFFIDTKQPLGTFANYLRYNDAWGTGRGLIWNRVLYSYTQLPFLQLLFGHGLDTTRLLLIDTFGETMALYDNAHNEILQYLVTTGIVGLLCYLSTLISSLKRLWIFIKKEPYAFAIAATMLCYFIQAIVNINQPITTPFLFMFLGIGESFIRQEQTQPIKQDVKN